jgi:hypothetical protein
MNPVERRRLGRAEAGVRNARTFFDLAERTFDLVGLDTAAENLRRYRSGVGGTRRYDDDEIESHLPVTEAEDTNRTQFEADTFTGRTGSEKAAEAMLRVRDGETRRFTDYWKVPLDYRNALGQRPAASLRRGLNADTYASFGQGEVMSRGTFTVSRRGNDLTVEGEVGHKFDSSETDNLYDFNEGALGGRAASRLEQAGEAAPFRMQYDRRQDVRARIRSEPDGSLTVRDVRWGRMR